MNRTTHYTYIKPLRIVLFFLILFTLQHLQAQQFHNLYWMQGIPQSAYSNPGLQPHPKVYVGLPGLSSISFSFAHSGFAINDLVRKDSDGTYFIDDQSMLSRLKGRNFLDVNYQHEILGFGFRSGRDYFSMNITERFDVRWSYPQDFMVLLVEGNDYFLQQNKSANLGGLRLDINHFREFGFAYSRHWTDELTAGARVKVLQGMGNVSFERSHMRLKTHANNYELLLQSDFLANTSLPFDLAPLDSLGEDSDFDFTEDDLRDYLTNTRNMGVAFDLGAVYQINDQFEVALSVRDLGFISWRQDVENFALHGEFEFEGIDFNDFFSSDDDDQFEQLFDSIVDLFEIEETARSYRRMISPTIFAAGAYNLTDMHKFGALVRTQFFAGRAHPSFTLSYNFQPISQFGTSLAYSVIHGNFSNVGFGAHVNMGPVQIYTVTDNILGFMRPHTLQTATIHFGLNVVIRSRDDSPHPKPSFRW